MCGTRTKSWIKTTVTLLNLLNMKPLERQTSYKDVQLQTTVPNRLWITDTVYYRQVIMLSHCHACVCVCLDGPVGDPGRHWPPASWGGALLCGGGDGGGHPELGQVRSQPLCSGKEPWARSIHRALLCQIDTFTLIISRRGEALRVAAP